MNDVPRNGDAPGQGRDAATDDHSLSTVAAARDVVLAAEAVTLELAAGLVLVVTADGCRHILAELDALEPIIATVAEP